MNKKHKFDNYINGHLVPPKGNEYFDNFEPATSQPYSLVPDSDERDIDAAVEAAKAAFPKWSRTPASERARYLHKIADAIESSVDSLARIESIDNGKPLALAKSADIIRGATNMRFFAGAIEHFASESHPMESGDINYTLRKPLGVVACISPWNFPFILLTWKIAPAIAAGNCVVAKPSEITPATARELSNLCRDIGLPPGVLNIVHGRGEKAGEALVNHPGIRAISFTGGTETGKRIAACAGPQFKKFSLELGGKNPNIVFADADMDQALEQSLRAGFTNQGQVCTSGSRLFVEKPIFDQFRDRFVAAAKALQVGDPLDPATDQGAIVSKEHMEKIVNYLKLAKEEGATFLCGGDRAELSGRCAQGWFIQPIVITGLSADCRTNCEEIFGPVVSLIPFESEEEVVQWANRTSYGLGASVWTQDLTRAHRMAEAIESGMVWVNSWMLRDLRTPFGGTKQSGAGREGGFETLRFFTEPKNVCIKVSPHA